ncbi:lysozyme inhibitor LprI family protein [Atlantibacter hermannii]|uniref:lysozyme inhibitor LprI family protein n=1 Tax=Atlantibacter hermannii TaxID=565 RepID=UPI00289AFBB0|nr:lysozyme inhibitor LprI family protein [Atlantibacter hermannii]
MKRMGLLCFALLMSSAALAEDCEKAETQMALNQCAASEYKKADGELNAAYKKVFTLASKEQHEMLRNAQNAWIKLRDADCDFVASGVEGGSIQPMIYSQCLTDKTRERTAWLESLLQCGEGDLSCPLPAATN